jgi:chromosome segregation ATPase
MPATTGLTVEEIHAAADGLDAQGQRPTLQAVRKALGRGSFTTISAAMSSWRPPQASVMSAEEPVPGAVAERTEAYAAQLWALAAAAADERIAVQKQELAAERAELVATRDEAVALADAITAELDEQRAAAATEARQYTERLEQAALNIAAAQHQGEGYRAEAEQAKVAAAELTGTLTALTAERDRLSSELAAVHRDKDQLAAERAELVAGRDEAVALAEAITAELDKQREAAAEQARHLGQQLDQATADAAAAREAGEQYRADTEQAKVAAAELAGALTALTAERDRLTADLAAAQTQIGRLTK